MKKRMLSILLALCMVICFLPTAALAGEGDQDITEVNLLGVSNELWSHTDVTFAAVDEGTNYTIVSQKWFSDTAAAIKPDSANLKPKARADYTFTITLEAKDGYVFPIKSESAVFYNGTVRLDGTEYDGGVTTVSSDGKMLTAILFPLTTAKGITSQEADVSTEDELAAALSDTSIDMIRLISDIDLTAWNPGTVGGFYIHLAITRKVTLDLNGYVLKGTGANSRIGVFEIMDGGDLTVIDSRPAAPHKFTDNDGLWVLDEQNGDKTVNGGIITGGRTNGGGGVTVCEGGRLTMSGGSIVGCLSENVNGSGGGGGVYLRNNSTFTMSGGGIIGCVAQDSGGGVFFYKNGTFTMTGGVIQNCTANDEGGDALFLYGGTMNAGGGTVDGTVVVDVAYDSASYSYIPGVIQGAQGSTATLFNGDVTNAGEIKCGTFNGAVTVGYGNFPGTISGGIFNGPVNMTGDTVDDEIKGGIFNDTVTVDRGKITNGTFNGLIKNNSTDARFAGTYSPLGIVGEEPTAGDSSVYHRVNFDPAGGKMDYPERYFLDKTQISDQIKPDDRVGYFFDGWYKADGTAWDHRDDKVNGNLILTAKWTACDHCGHTGAQPDCTTSVTCTACGGTIAALGHDFSVQQHDNNEHWKKCARCDATNGKSEHDWDNGTVTVPASCITSGEKKYTCRECGFEKAETLDAKGHIYDDAWQHDATQHWHDCTNCEEKLDAQAHTGGTATCTEKAKCAVCGASYGNLDPDHHAPDGQQEWTRTATAHRQKWSCCGAVTVASESHEWTDGVCSRCGYVCTHDDTDSDHICDLCGQVVSDHQDTDNDHICNLCGTVISDHTGGKATCKAPAVCAVCGKAYGETDANAHADLKHIAAKAATKTATGNTEYWYCADCGKYFADAAATKEIQKADTVTAKLPEAPKSPQTGAADPVLLGLALLLISGGCTVCTVRRKKSHLHGGHVK